MVAAFPEAAKEKNGSGNLPLHSLLSGRSFHKKGDRVRLVEDGKAGKAGRTGTLTFVYDDDPLWYNHIKFDDDGSG